MQKTLRALTGVGLTLALTWGMAPAAHALNGDDTQPEILSVVVPEKVVPGENTASASRSVTTRCRSAASS